MNIFVIGLSIVALVSAGGLMKPLKVGQECPGSVQYYKVSAFYLVPDPPKAGASVTATSIGTFTQAEVLIASYSVVYYGNVPVYRETIPISGSYAAGQSANFTSTQAIPAIAPSGSYKIEGGLVNSNNEKISCWEVDFKL
jgi:ML domain